MKNGVGIYGGFLGTETLRSQRNPASNVTVLSGDIGSAEGSEAPKFTIVIGRNLK